jgi:clan AA aspartic protease (TIGR02281 family)
MYNHGLWRPRGRHLTGMAAALFCFASAAHGSDVSTSAAIARAHGGLHVMLPNGEAYSGEMIDGVRQGSGAYSWPDGRRYVGEFRDGLPDGNGLYTFPTGEFYQGEFRRNRRAGLGVYTWPDGRRYVGQFADDLPDGDGVYSWPDGRRYAGGFRRGLASGRGVFEWPDGRRYEGEIRDELPDGMGTLTFANGRRLSGSFRRGDYVGEAPLAGELPKKPAAPAASPFEIRMGQQGGTFTVPVRVNDAVTLDFHIDSGAADVSIPANVFDRLRQTGRITTGDIEGEETYLMADGRRHTARIFRIRSLQLGTLVRENVRASVSEDAGPALLGMSFLRRFGSWSFDNERQILTVR